MSQEFKCPYHTRDVLPEDHQYHTYIKKVVRHRSRQGGIRRITTPTFEDKDIFETLLGKEQFQKIENLFMRIKRPESNKICLMRPNLVFGILRSYVEQRMEELPKPIELYAFEKAYLKRADRNHEFDTYTVVILGEDDPVLDTQLIKLGLIIFKDLKIEKKVKLHLNTLGCPNCLPKYINNLEQHYYGKEHSMCQKCQEDLKRGDLLKLLNCPEEDCQILAKVAPKIQDYLCKDCSDHFERLNKFLEALEIKYELDATLLPSIHFYQKTYFEFRVNDKTILQGGRFDQLLEKICDEQTPAVGFELCISSLVEVLKEEGLKVPYKDNVHVFLAQLGADAKEKSLPLLYKLREEGIKTVGAMGKGSMNQQIDLAHKMKVDYALILGQIEVNEGTIILRDMKKGKQKTIPFEKAISELKKLLGTKSLDKYKEGPDGMLT